MATFTAHADCDKLGSLQLTIAMLSGESTSLTIGESATIAELGSLVEEQFGIPLKQQRLQVSAFDFAPCGLEGALSLTEAGICSGACIQAICSAVAAIAAFPPHFGIQCMSSRERLGGQSVRRYSSAFTIHYDVKANVPGGYVDVVKWRKNDNDQLRFDTKGGTLSGTTSHWMAGSSTFQDTFTSDTKDATTPLEDLLAHWIESATPVYDKRERFWKLPDVEASVEDGENTCSEDQVFHVSDPSGKLWPDHKFATGWFVAPDEDCSELRIEALLPSRIGKKLLRVLVNKEGLPVRAALSETNPCHLAVEEYDLTLKALAKEVE